MREHGNSRNVFLLRECALAQYCCGLGEIDLFSQREDQPECRASHTTVPSFKFKGNEGILTQHDDMILLQRMSTLMALPGHSGMSAQCPLLRVDRK